MKLNLLTKTFNAVRTKLFELNLSQIEIIVQLESEELWLENIVVIVVYTKQNSFHSELTSFHTIEFT